MDGAGGVDTSTWPTRERILVESSRLFATRGFLGTSTRDIASAVGIRQPSVYSHFGSKHEIAAELLRRDLTAGVEALGRLAAAGGGPAVELYRYLLWEVRHVRGSAFDLRALYLGEILDLPELEEGRRLNDTYTRRVEDLVRRGIAADDFLDIDIAFACTAIDAIVLETIRGAATRTAPALDEPDLAASFVVRALLRRPSRLPAVRAAAHRHRPVPASAS
jgi:AcrR family transcriptional regulator